MPPARRPLTTREAAQIRAALPHHLKPLMDVVCIIQCTCWNCEHFSTADGYCGLHEDTVPMDKRRDEFECFVPKEEDPF